MVSRLTRRKNITDIKEVAANLIPAGVCPLQTLQTFFVSKTILFESLPALI